MDPAQLTTLLNQQQAAQQMMQQMMQQMQQQMQQQQERQQQQADQLAQALQMLATQQQAQQAQADGLNQGLQQTQAAVQATINQVAQQAAQAVTANIPPPPPAPQVQPAPAASPMLIDIKAVGKPTVFEGKDEKFHGWRFKTRNFVNGIFAESRQVLTYVETLVGEVNLAELGTRFPECQSMLADLNRQLYTLMCSLVENDPLVIVENTPDGQGLEAWRRLSKRYDPFTGGRKRSLLDKIIKPEQVKLNQLLTSLEAWEKQVTVYEQRNKKTLDEDIKISALTSMCPKVLSQHIDLNADDFTDYSTVRTLIVSYVENQTSGTATPMDISAIGKVVCFHCGGPHLQKECSNKRRQQTPEGKQAQQAGGKGAGKGNKGKGGGKTGGRQGNASGTSGLSGGKGHQQDKSNVVCHNCGKNGHTKKECFRPGGGAFDPDYKSKQAAGKQTTMKPVGSVDGSTGSSSSSVDPQALALAQQIQTLLAKATGDKKNVSGIFKPLGSIEKCCNSVYSLKPADPDQTEQAQSAVNNYDEWDEAAVDSGAAVSVCPRDYATDYHTYSTIESESGVEYKVANGQTIKEEGRVTPLIMTQEGHVRQLSMNRCDVHKILLSADKIVDSGDKGHYILLHPTDSHIGDLATGERIELQRRNGTFVLPMRKINGTDVNAIVSATSSSSNSAPPFHRQVPKP